MKIIIEGSPKELAKLAAVLNGAATAEKKAEIPPLLTELASEKLSGNDKINELAEAIRNVVKENAPQTETAEQSGDVGIAKQSIDNLRKMISEKTAEFFAEYADAVSNATDEHASFNHCFYLRLSAHKMWEMLSKSVVANIWNFDTLFL